MRREKHEKAKGTCPGARHGAGLRGGPLILLRPLLSRAPNMRSTCVGGFKDKNFQYLIFME